MQREAHTPETEEYGIGSFVYRRRKPFHPERLMAFLEQMPEEVVRAKGIVWIASRNRIAGMISQAGPSIQFGPSGYWLAALPPEEQQAMREQAPESFAAWDPVWGDRATELVLIGIELDREAIEAELDDCLLADAEMMTDWSMLNDPLPPWPIEEAQ